jgi:hypothetical protein
MHTNYPFGNFEGNLGGDTMGRSSAKRRRSYLRRNVNANVRRFVPQTQQVFTPPCENRPIQYLVIGATYLDTISLGINTVKLSLDDNQNVRALITIGGNNDSN